MALIAALVPMATAEAAPPGTPAPVRPLPVCERLSDPPRGACPIESEYFELSASGTLDAGNPVSIGFSANIPACETFNGQTGRFNAVPCYSQIGVAFPRGLWEPFLCYYFNDETQRLEECSLVATQDLETFDRLIERQSTWTFPSAQIVGDRRGCTSVPNFAQYVWGAPRGTPFEWARAAETFDTCTLTMTRTPDNLEGATWLAVAGYLEVAVEDPDSDAHMRIIEFEEVFVGVNGTLGPLAANPNEPEFPDPDPDPDPGEVFSPVGPFLDVRTNSFARADIALLYDLGITNGVSDDAYGPALPVTREQMASFLARTWRALGESCPAGDPPFADLAPTSFAYDDATCIFELGITTGVGGGRYDPASDVTREQMASFLARFWRSLGNDCPSPDTGFTDVAATSFARDDIACIFGLGITNGTSSTTYGPAQLVTREQMAAFLGRIYRAATT